MKEGTATQNVAAPHLGHGNIDDGIEVKRVDVTGRRRRLRTLQGRSAQRQVIKLEIEAESEVLAVVAGNASGCDPAPAADKFRGRAVGETRSAAYVEDPVLV